MDVGTLGARKNYGAMVSPLKWNRKSPQLQAASKLHLGDISYLFKSTNQLLLRLVLSAMRHGPRYKVWTVWRNERSNPWFPEASFRWALSNLGIGGTNIEAVSECPQFGSLIGEKSQAFSSFCSVSIFGQASGIQV